MVENAELMKCGNCGCDTIKLYQVKDFLVAECTQCKSTSHIKTSYPSIVIDWGENSEGILGVF